MVRHRTENPFDIGHGLVRQPDPSMQAGPAGGGEVLAYGLAKEGMGEGVVAGDPGHLHHSLGPDTLVECVEKRFGIIGRVGHPLEESEAERATDDGPDGQRPVSSPRHAREPVAQKPEHPFRQHDVLQATIDPPASVMAVDRAGVGQVVEDLAHEERVAAGMGVELVEEGQALGVELLAGDACDQLDTLGLVQSPEGDRLHPRLPVQLGQ